MQDFWNERYGQADYVYGKAPNAYFKSIIDGLPAGKMLIPGAGEGRDAVYAATQSWLVDAFDYSTAGREKALQLAAKADVSINFEVLNAADFDPTRRAYDCIALIFFHLPSDLRQAFHKKVVQALRPGGVVVLEAFTPEQMNNNSGGPKNPDMLMRKADVEAEFPELRILKLEELETELNEGAYHRGKAAVLRFLGMKM